MGSEVTLLIQRMDREDGEARERLLELTYRELRRMAGGFMAQERRGHTLQATALVHEAFIKLCDGNVLDDPKSRAYFFGAAARAMRQILRDHAAARRAHKRGGDWRREDGDSVLIHLRAPEQVDPVELNELLDQLQQHDSRLHDVVVLRLLGGLTHQEIAHEIGTSVSTVENEWKFAKAWLSRRLRR